MENIIKVFYIKFLGQTCAIEYHQCNEEMDSSLENVDTIPHCGGSDFVTGLVLFQGRRLALLQDWQMTDQEWSFNW